MGWFKLVCLASLNGIAFSSRISDDLCNIDMTGVDNSRRNHRRKLLDLALCFHRQNAIPNALEVYSELRREFPDYAFPLVNIAHVHIKNSQAQEAVKVLSTYFNEVGGWLGGETPTDSDSLVLGSPCLKSALNREDCVSALNLYGLAHSFLYEHQVAIRAYERAIEIGEDVLIIDDVFVNLGTLLYETGHDDKARELFLRSFRSMSKNNVVKISSLFRRALLVESVPESLEAAASKTSVFNKNMGVIEILMESGGIGLLQRNAHLDLPMDIEDIRQIPPLARTFDVDSTSMLHFHLPYYGFREREALERVVSIMQTAAKIPLTTTNGALQFYKPPSTVSNVFHMADTQPDRGISPKEKAKIIFISCLFGDNEPHAALLLDVLRTLPSTLFESIAISVGLKQPCSDFLEVFDGRVFSVGYDREKARSIILSQSPDVVIFVENLNSAIMHYLSYERFAPIQILLMGAPHTSGVSDSIDYFLSGDRIEHPFRTHISGDLSHVEPYTEQVILFDGQAISFPWEENHPSQNSTLAAGEAVASYSLLNDTDISFKKHDEFGIPRNDGRTTIYICFQNLFKIQPVFDTVMARILHGDPDGYIILQASRFSQKNKVVQKRIKTFMIDDFCQEGASRGAVCDTAKEILSRIYFIPRVTSDQLTHLLQKATVALHPFPFDGSKTASDVLRSGVPLVTFPQRYLRGRLAQTFYSTMAMHEIDAGVAASICCVANDIGDYVSKAIRLGKDRKYHHRVASAIKARMGRIYDDKETSFEWVSFLSRAIGISMKREDLANLMGYVPEMWQTEYFHEKVMLAQQSRWKRRRMEQFLLSQ